MQTVGIYVDVPTVRATLGGRTRKLAGVVGTRELARRGLSRTAIQRLAKAGTLERVGRGLYVPAGARITEHHSLVEAARRVPRGVVCLLSALGFHGLGTQMPHQVWMAIERKARKPAGNSPPLRIVRFSGKALTYGTETHEIEGVEVRMTSPAKTVADCFKYRNKIGLDVATEALKAYLGQRGHSMDDLVAASAVCRVAHVIRPYIEAMT